MAITLVATIGGAPGINGGNIPFINTTGANLLVVSVAYFATITVSDNRGNTFVPLTERVGSGGVKHRLYYVRNPAVGTPHIVTIAGTGIYTSAIVQAWTDPAGAPTLGSQTGAGSVSAGTSLVVGSVTPSADGALVITGLAVGGYPQTLSVNAGLTPITAAGAPGSALYSGVGYTVQSTAAPVSPTWSWTASADSGASLAVFLSAAAAAPTVRVSQAIVEAASTVPVSARVSQAVVEVAAGIPAALRLSQAIVEVATALPAPMRVSQAIVEVVSPAVLQPVPEYLNPGWLAWIEWPSSGPATRSGPVPPIVAYSDWDLQDPPAYYHGYKQARVERFGEAARTLSEPRTGDWQGSSCDVRLSDYDRRFRTMLASETERYWTTGPFILRMVTRPVRAVLGEPLTVFVGPLRRADPGPPLSLELLLEDVVGHGMLNDQALIPQRVLDASDWVGTIDLVEASRGHPVPIIYGTHGRPGGSFAPIYLGLEGDHHVWLVAGHAAQVLDVFIDGVSVLGTEGVDWTLPGMSGPATEDIAGKRYTLLRGRKGTPSALANPVLYAENAGPSGATFESWIAGSPLTGGTDIQFDVNATTDPHGGTRHIEGIDLRDGELVRGAFGLTGDKWVSVPPGYVIGEYDNLRFWVKNATTFWPVGVSLEIEFRIQFPFSDPPLLAAIGTVVTLVHGVYGFNETVTTWQEVVIPTADFGMTTERADYILIRKTGTDEITLSLDDIRLEGEPGGTGELTQADMAAVGTSQLTVNVSGWTTTGDSSGLVLAAIADQYQHFLVTYVAHPDGYLTGPPLANPTSDLFDRVVTVVDEESFNVAKAQALARYPPDGYLGHAILGATPGDRLPVRQWLARWNLSADVRFGVNRYGQLFVVMHDPTATHQAEAPLVDEVLDILEGSFAIDMGWTSQATRVPFRAGFNYATGQWTVIRDAEDSALGAAYGRPEGIPGEPREYWFIADTDQAKNVAEHEVQRIGHPARVLQFETALGALVTEELGRYIRVRHFAGVGPSAERLCQIEALTIAPGTRRLRVRALDVTDLIDATAREEEP
jgi:hypothetical protein